MPTWPRQSECARFYGRPGTGHTTITCPWPLKLAWDTKTIITKFTIHKKCAESALTVMEAVLEHYGLDEIKRLRLDLWGGCYNNRKMRGSSALSMHAFACAIDWDPDHNQLRWSKNDKPPHHPTLSDPPYEKWWEFWEKDGWVSLGRTIDRDHMHVQAARL